MAFNHCFFSCSLGACSVCEWPPAASVLDILKMCLAVEIESTCFRKLKSSTGLQELAVFN